jgi:pilus assembly protein TadC
MTLTLGGLLAYALVLVVWPDRSLRMRRLAGGGASRGRAGQSPRAAALWAAWREHRAGRAASKRRLDIALALDLLAVALSSGAPTPVALHIVGTALGEPGRVLVRTGTAVLLGADESLAWSAADDDSATESELLAVVHRQLAAMSVHGASCEALLRARADAIRRSRRRTAEAAAQRLGVRLVLPIGLCALPAFVALGIVPVVLGLLQGMT